MDTNNLPMLPHKLERITFQPDSKMIDENDVKKHILIAHEENVPNVLGTNHVMASFTTIEEKEYHIQTKILARRCKEMILKAYEKCKNDDERKLIIERANIVYKYFLNELNDRAVMNRNTEYNLIS